MPKQAPSNRAAGKVNLSFGIVNIATTLYTGTVSDHGITRKEYVSTPEGDHPCGRGVIDKVTGELVEVGSEVVKKIETEYGPVYVEDAEIEKLFQLAPDSLVVKEFQPQHLFHQGHYIPKGLQFVEPRVVGTGRKKGPDPVATKLLLTLLKGMREQNALAVCELTTRGVPKPCILMPDGRLWHVYHTDATREQRELPEAPIVDAEVQMLGSLIKTMWSDQPADLTDERSTLIQAFADEKAAAGEFDKPEVDATVSAPAPAATPDLMALLSASVEQAKADRVAS